VRVRYVATIPADCTSDPHPVSYGELKGEKKRLTAMFDDILRVCESDMIEFIRILRCTIDGKQYVSDYYDKTSWEKRSKRANTPEAKQNKHAGYFIFDAEDETSDGELPAKQKLPAGLAGVRRIKELALKTPSKFESLSIGVIWAFAGDSSCSDYIEINGEYTDGPDQVNYGSQDSWISKEGYKSWCSQMEKFLGRHFPRSGD